jgi:very-short-patch-repair endonuclease
MLRYDSRLKATARRLRREMTDAETHLWYRLRGKQIFDVQFYRQKVIGPYVVDFYGAAAKLVIEIDGSQHFEPESAECDRIRTDYLSGRGLLVMRFDNRQVLLETNAVLNSIFDIVQQRLNDKNPP